MEVDWEVLGYKARLDAAIAGDRWDEVENVRIAAKRRLMELTVGGHARAVEQARDGLADSLDSLQLSKRIRIGKGALATATKLSADAETSGIAVDVVSIPLSLARNVKEAILQRLGGGNRRPMTSGELARHTGHRPETIARSLAQLRAEKKIVSRRVGRHVFHHIPSPPSRTNFLEVFDEASNRTASDVSGGVRNADSLSAKTRPDLTPEVDSATSVGMVKQHFPPKQITKSLLSPPATLSSDDIFAADVAPVDPKVMAMANRISDGGYVNDRPGDAPAAFVMDNRKV